MTPNKFTYPVCGCSCGCSMTAKSNCDDCYYRSKHSEMGATWNVCTQYSDLSEATRACDNSKECKLKITHKQAREAIDRQIPKKLKIEKHNHTFCDCGHKFSICLNDCYAIPFNNKTPYCPNCGQAIDWSGER